MKNLAFVIIGLILIGSCFFLASLAFLTTNDGIGAASTIFSIFSGMGGVATVVYGLVEFASKD